MFGGWWFIRSPRMDGGQSVQTTLCITPAKRERTTYHERSHAVENAPHPHPHTRTCTCILHKLAGTFLRTFPRVVKSLEGLQLYPHYYPRGNILT
jgi:hypothetical protein